MDKRTKEVYTCCYKGCERGDLTINDARIEVCTKLPKHWENKSTRKKFLIKWSSKGEARFHFNCWQELLNTARAYKKKKNALPLLQTEKNMIKEAAKTQEKYGALDTNKHQAKRIAEMIKNSKHLCAFTGAGISTSAGIGDYRGKRGKWTEEDRERKVVDCDEPVPKKSRQSSSSKHHIDLDASESENEEEKDPDSVPYEDLRPTYTHEALFKLHQLGYLKYVISQNCDGLHILSGLPQSVVSELHGNVFIEKCESCNTRYERNYYVMDDVATEYYEELEDNGTTDIKKPAHATKCVRCGLCHRTGRKCTQKLPTGKKCNGYLMDTIINFRDHLEDPILDRAEDMARKCDAMLCLGTTLQVTPASSLVSKSEVENYRFIIINRQETDEETRCFTSDADGNPLGSRVYGDCDDIMRLIMANILIEKDLSEWENGRQFRMKTYDKQRK